MVAANPREPLVHQRRSLNNELERRLRPMPVATCSSQLHEHIRRHQLRSRPVVPRWQYAAGATSAKLSEYHATMALAAIPRWDKHKAVRARLYRHYGECLEAAGRCFFGGRILHAGI